MFPQIKIVEDTGQDNNNKNKAKTYEFECEALYRQYTPSSVGE